METVDVVHKLEGKRGSCLYLSLPADALARWTSVSGVDKRTWRARPPFRTRLLALASRKIDRRTERLAVFTGETQSERPKWAGRRYTRIHVRLIGAYETVRVYGHYCCVARFSGGCETAAVAIELAAAILSGNSKPTNTRRRARALLPINSVSLPCAVYGGSADVRNGAKKPRGNRLDVRSFPKTRIARIRSNFLNRKNSDLPSPPPDTYVTIARRGPRRRRCRPVAIWDVGVRQCRKHSSNDKSKRRLVRSFVRAQRKYNGFRKFHSSSTIIRAALSAVRVLFSGPRPHLWTAHLNRLCRRPSVFGTAAISQKTISIVSATNVFHSPACALPLAFCRQTQRTRTKQPTWKRPLTRTVLECNASEATSEPAEQ